MKFSELFHFLAWSEPYAFKRETTSSYEEDQDWQYETGPESEEDNIDNENISVAESEKLQTSVATGRKAYHKKSNKQADRLVEQELQLTNKLAQRLTESPAPKDDDASYGELLASKLSKLSSQMYFQANRKTDNTMFKYLLAR